MSSHTRKYIFYIFILVAVAAAAGCKQQEIENRNFGKSDYEYPIDPVDVFVLKSGAFNKELVSNGKLTALQKSDLKFKVSGQLKKLTVKNGDKVKTTQLLAALDQFEYNQKVAHAQTEVRNAKIELMDILLSYNAVDTSTISDAIMEAAQLRSGYTNALNNLKLVIFDLEGTTLRSPFSGKVANIKSKIHESIESGQVFCTIIDDDEFEVEFQLIESEIDEVMLGDQIKIIPFSNPTVYRGSVSEINPVIDENGMVQVKATVKNPGTLWEGMNVRVLVEKAVADQMAIPKGAIVLRQNQEVLFKYSNGKAVWTYVQIGFENSKYYTVTPHNEKNASLKPGDTVIVSNNLNLAHESKVKIRSLVANRD